MVTTEATIPDDAWKLPPLAAVTGVVGLRENVERCVRRDDRRIAEADDDPEAMTWDLDGSIYGAKIARSRWDIIAQVSVGPTGPGRYETASGAAITLDGHDNYGWRSPWDGGLWDEFGRYFLPGNKRRAEGDLRRRIGDLPEPDAVPADVPAPGPAVVTRPGVYRDKNGWGILIVGKDEHGWYSEPPGLRRWADNGWCEAEKPAYLRERVGDESMWSCVSGTATPDELAAMLAADGRAAMDAIWGDGVPTVGEAVRTWLHESLQGLASAVVHATGKGFVLTAAPNRFMISEAGILPVSRDDLRVLYEVTLREAVYNYEGVNPNGVCTLPYEDDYRALSAAAAALGDVELPKWMREHAAKEGWT